MAVHRGDGDVTRAQGDVLVSSQATQGQLRTGREGERAARIVEDGVLQRSVIAFPEWRSRRDFFANIPTAREPRI